MSGTAEIEFAKTVTAEMSIYARPDKQDKFGFKLILVDDDMTFWTRQDDINIGKVSVSYDTPGYMTREQLVLKAVTTLQQKQQEERDESEIRVQQLQQQINDLQLLTHKPDVELVQPSEAMA